MRVLRLPTITEWGARGAVNTWYCCSSPGLQCTHSSDTELVDLAKGSGRSTACQSVITASAESRVHMLPYAPLRPWQRHPQRLSACAAQLKGGHVQTNSFLRMACSQGAALLCVRASGSSPSQPDHTLAAVGSH